MTSMPTRPPARNDTAGQRLLALAFGSYGSGDNGVRSAFGQSRHLHVREGTPFPAPGRSARSPSRVASLICGSRRAG
jgi:hypothetical protein